MGFNANIISLSNEKGAFEQTFALKSGEYRGEIILQQVSYKKIINLINYSKHLTNVTFWTVIWRTVALSIFQCSEFSKKSHSKTEQTRRVSFGTPWNVLHRIEVWFILKTDMKRRASATNEKLFHAYSSRLHFGSFGDNVI